MPPAVSVVLPCLNEVQTVGAVVREAYEAMRAAGVEGEVIVVDNGSTDASEIAAAEAGARVVSERRRGYGNAYRAGFRAAFGEVVLMADADGSYDLGALPRFLERVRAGDELVMGSRFQGNIAPGAMPWSHRYIGNPLLSGLLNLLYRTGVQDAHCGIRAFRRDALPRMNLRTTGMEFASEMVVNAARAGLRIGEVPVDYRLRGGTSKLRSIRDAWRHVRFLFLYSPTHLFVIPGAALFLVGLVLLVALLPGPLRLAGFFLDVHYMILGALLTLLGAQVIAIGVSAKVLAVALGLQPRDPGFARLRDTFSLERGLVVGAVLFSLGLGIDVAITARWVASGFGQLDAVRAALFGLTVMVLGLQVAFSAFFLSAIDLQARGPA